MQVVGQGESRASLAGTCATHGAWTSTCAFSRSRRQQVCNKTAGGCQAGGHPTAWASTMPTCPPQTTCRSPAQSTGVLRRRRPTQGHAPPRGADQLRSHCVTSLIRVPGVRRTAPGGRQPGGARCTCGPPVHMQRHPPGSEERTSTSRRGSATLGDAGARVETRREGAALPATAAAGRAAAGREHCSMVGAAGAKVVGLQWRSRCVVTTPCDVQGRSGAPALVLLGRPTAAPRDQSQVVRARDSMRSTCATKLARPAQRTRSASAAHPLFTAAGVARANIHHCQHHSSTTRRPAIKQHSATSRLSTQQTLGNFGGGDWPLICTAHLRATWPARFSSVH